MLFDRLAARVPAWLSRPLSIAAGVMAIAGTVLVLSATVYGSWVMAAVAAGAFALGAVIWQVGDRH